MKFGWRSGNPSGLVNTSASGPDAPRSRTPASKSARNAVTCRGASAKEADFLDIEPNQAVFEVLLVATDADGVPVSVTQHVMAGHQWQLRYDWSDDPSRVAETADA